MPAPSSRIDNVSPHGSFSPAQQDLPTHVPEQVSRFGEDEIATTDVGGADFPLEGAQGGVA